MKGTKVLHYEILEKLGEGGMGVVYKARDTKLERFVALKFLPPHLNASEQDKARFIQEARAAAALNHPNVCSVIDISEQDGTMFIVMEFVDGQTLREKRGTINLAKAIDIGIQIAEGLSVAHENGIVHRDIKPENIMVRKDGIVQIMDFGLAKLRASRASRLTKEGSTVGTAGYMSPEQVQGQDTDHRSDIFSLGVLLYELFTGELPFKGVHETALLYEIVNVDPVPMSVAKPEIDPELDRIVLECLQKDPDERYNSVKDIAKDLKRFKRESSRQRMSRTMPARALAAAQQSGVRPELEKESTSRIPVREFIAWGVVALLIALSVYLYTRPAPVTQTAKIIIRSSIVTPDSLYIHSFGAGLGPPVISPDGQTIAFTGVTPDGTRRIYVRPIGGTDARTLPGTDGGTGPFWSPDGKYVGFFDAGKMKKIDLVGGSPITIASVPNPRGGAWNRDGTIVFAPDFQSGLYKISADGGGNQEQVTSLDSTRHEGSHRWPFFLPDGKHFLYLARAAVETGQAEGDAVFVASLDGSMKKLLIQSSFNAAYAGGFLLFARESMLLAQRFDPITLSLEGDPVKVQEGMLTDLSYNMAVFTVSNTGTLLFQTGQAEAGARPIFLDRTGSIMRTLDDRSEQNQPRFSPDGSQIALYLYDIRSRRSNIWIYDLSTGGRRRLTSRSEGDFWPVWSADGENIYFSSGALSLRDVFVQPVSRSGSGTKIFSSPGEDIVRDRSRDGKTIIVESTSLTESAGDLWLVSTGDAKAQPVAFQKTQFNERRARISPDNVWVAFMSDESGEDEIYLKRLSDPESDPWKISSGGGAAPVWGPGGKELFYVDTENRIVAVTIRFSGAKGEVVSTTPLFQLPAFSAEYDISPDGKTFVVTRDLEIQKYPPMSLVIHWEESLRMKEKN